MCSFNKNAPMNKPLIIKNDILIHAPAEIVWDVLTSPEHTPKYMFGCQALSDWRQGSSLVWKGVFDGKELIAVKGDVLRIERPFLLEYSVFDPNSNYPDVPENYTSVIYKLRAEDGGTRLTVTQGDFATVIDGEKRYQDSIAGGGWASILDQIKQVAESVPSPHS
jgi:uncharacterized protein YndB with AHSA1/START domain